MRARTRYSLLVAVLLGVACVEADDDAAHRHAPPHAAPGASPPPNIIWAFADDFCYNCVSARNPEVHTPTLDALAADGVQLDRLYAYKYCSPSRSSFLSGRLPLHVTQNNKNNLVTNPGGADLRMTLLPQKLKQAGYVTSAVGKWHVGARSAANLPINRGFDRHFGFLKGGEDHITQHSGDAGLTFVDLWRDHVPAVGENGTFSTFLYANEAVNVIESHAERNRAAEAAGQAAAPLAMYLAWQATHTPLEHPARFFKQLPNDTPQATRSHMRALVGALDEGVSNVTAALKRTGLWNNTLLFVVADNGGWIQPTLGGNNWPLRGGKVSDFEGGVRSYAFMNGGYLDSMPELRGTTNTGLMHVADFYATFCKLAGVDPTDSAAGVPPIDSLDLTDSLFTPGASTSPRTEVPLSFCNAEAACDAPSGVGDSALISGRYKLVNGTQGNLGYWQGPQYPNATSAKHPGSDPGCPSGCLFDIFADPAEQNDLREAQPDVFARLAARLAQIGATTFQTNNTGGADTCIPAQQAYDANGGFLSPRCSR